MAELWQKQRRDCNARKTATNPIQTIGKSLYRRFDWQTILVI